MQSKDLKDEEDGSYDCPDRHTVLHVEVEEAVDLTASVKVHFDDGVEPVEIEKLLEEQGRSYL